MKKQKGLGLIGVLLIIGALAVTTGGVVVWQKKISPTPTPTPPSTPIQTPSPKPESTSPTESPTTQPTKSPTKKPEVGEECTRDEICRYVAIPLWYFDPETNSCIQILALCGGNSFKTKGECEAACL